MNEHEQPYWFQQRYNALVRRILERWEPGKDQVQQAIREMNAAWERLWYESIMRDLGGEG